MVKCIRRRWLRTLQTSSTQSEAVYYPKSIHKQIAVNCVSYSTAAWVQSPEHYWHFLAAACKWHDIVLGLLG